MQDLLKNYPSLNVHQKRLPKDAEKVFMQKLEKEGYSEIKWVQGLGYCGLRSFVFTCGICYGLGEFDYDGRWCYENPFLAISDFLLLNCTNEPSGNWQKHKGKIGEWSKSEKQK